MIRAVVRRQSQHPKARVSCYTPARRAHPGLFPELIPHHVGPRHHTGGPDSAAGNLLDNNGIWFPHARLAGRSTSGCFTQTQSELDGTRACMVRLSRNSDHVSYCSNLVLDNACPEPQVSPYGSAQIASLSRAHQEHGAGAADPGHRPPGRAATALLLAVGSRQRVAVPRSFASYYLKLAMGVSEGRSRSGSR